MEKRQLLYEGKAKRIYHTEDEEVLWVVYKDSATAFNGSKQSEILGKGQLNNKITSLLFTLLKAKGIDNHFIEKISDNEQLVRRVTIFPLEVVVRNRAAGALAKRLGFKEGTVLPHPITEFYYKNDALNDPLVTEEHIAILKLATPDQLAAFQKIALEVNEVLQAHFASRCNLQLIDFKLEFGEQANGNLLLADEISPDTCRLWDLTTHAKLDKDIFRRDLGSLTTAYQEVLQRLGGSLCTK